MSIKPFWIKPEQPKINIVEKNVPGRDKMIGGLEACNFGNKKIFPRRIAGSKGKMNAIVIAPITGEGARMENICCGRQKRDSGKTNR